MKHYRPDIDGLRAIAVSAVVLFHAFPTLVPGGYVGVDVFFVISGYLITGILLSEVAQDRFSILRFYIRRARRLFPALSVVLLTVLVFGWFSLLPLEFELLGKHVLGGAGFVSNIVLWRELGYFDVNSELKPLLHLWSLGVEEQYYLLWPLLVFLLARRGRWFLYGTTALICTSFVLNVYWIDKLPTATFYLPVTRFWELLVGSLLAFLVSRHASQPEQAAATRFRWGAHLLSAGGLLLIGLSIFLFDRQTPFPGWAATLPVLGTACMIAAGPAAPLNYWLLSNRLFVWIGLISYPLYLWHWPLFAFYRILLGKPLSVAAGAGLSLLAVALAWSTWRFIERPFRRSQPIAVAARDAARLWASTIALGICGLAMWLAWLAPRSASSPVVQLVTEASKDWRLVDNGTLKGDRPERVLFIGDSYMQQYLPRIEKLMRDRLAPVYTVQFKTAAGCAPFSGIERKSTACHQFVTDAFAMARDPAVKTVVIAASWHGFSTRNDYYRIDDPTRQPIEPFAPENDWIFDRWRQELGELILAQKRIVIVSTSPSGEPVRPTQWLERRPFEWHTATRPPVKRAALYRVVANADLRIRQVANDVGAEIVDPYDWLCDVQTCEVATAAGKPIYFDGTHLRTSFVMDHLTMLDPYVYVSGMSVAESPFQ